MATSGALSTSNQYVKYTISVTQNSQNVTTNRSNVTVSVRFYRTNTGYTTYGSGTVYCKINGTTYSAAVTSSQKITNSGIVLFTKTLDIPHNDDGTKSLTCSAWISLNTPLSSSEQSYTQALTTIPRKSTMTIGAGTLGSAQAITVTRQSSSFTHSISVTCGIYTVTVCSMSSETNISFTPPVDWASQNTANTVVYCTYKITTYSGSTNVGSVSYGVNCNIPASVKPSCAISVSDATGYANTYGGYIKGKSKLTIDVTPTKAYGSDITAYRVSANGVTYSAKTFTTGPIISSGSQTITATVTDKRGRSGNGSASINVLDYNPPSIDKLTVKRCDSNGTENNRGEYVQITFSYLISALNNKNHSSMTLQYKKSSETDWTSIDTTDFNDWTFIDNEVVVFEADSGSSYDIAMTLADNFESVRKATVASTAATILHFKSNGRGVGVGKISEVDDTLEIGYATCLHGGLLYPILQNGTDFNNVTSPGFYSLNALQTSEYLNCPLTTGSANLIVESCGGNGQLKQTVTRCHKTNPITYERFYHGESWGEWIKTSEYNGTLLWSGASHMNGSQTINLAEKVSEQPSGIVLVFSYYDNSANEVYDSNFSTHFIPKMQIANHAGSGHTFLMATNGDLLIFASKYLEIYDGYIAGNNNNTANGTAACGIKYSNNYYVLRYVIGV